MDNENKNQLRRKWAKTTDLELAHSADLGSSQLPKNKKNTGKSGIVKFVRGTIIPAVTITIGAVIIMVNTNAFKKRQQDMTGKIETPIVKKSNTQVSQIDFHVASDAGNRILKVRAVIKNTRNITGNIAMAKFEAHDRNNTLITDWPSPLLAEPIRPEEEQIIESSFFELPGDIQRETKLKRSSAKTSKSTSQYFHKIMRECHENN